MEGEVAARVREEEEARRREEEERDKRKRERDRAKVEIFRPPPTPDWHLLPPHLLAARYLPCRERLSMST